MACLPLPACNAMALSPVVECVKVPIEDVAYVAVMTVGTMVWDDSSECTRAIIERK